MAAGLAIKSNKNYNVEDFLNKKDAKRMDRYTQFAIVAATEALADSKLNLDNINIETENNTNSIAEGVVKNEIITLLENNSVYSAGVNCSSSVNADNEIILNSVTVSVADEYDCDTVKQLIYDELSLNVRVIHIGE